MEQETADDPELMAALAAGDDQAMAGLMARWEVPLKRYLQRLLLNAADAEDLAQETFVRLYKARRDFKRGAAVSPFLYAIASNLAKNRLRWRGVRRLISLGGGGRDHPALQVADASAASGAEAALESERVNAVRNAIAGLPHDLRIAIVLAEYEGLSHAEIGAALDCTPKAVEGRLHRARAALRTTLARWV
ncbi:MAG TPA: sigma-70 family RNA polymerase sigma factor [Opitutaceae bacterium]|nr:sigma-70 family RNA polymerase sigma factor [Opitutaceae bacterium]